MGVKKAALLTAITLVLSSTYIAPDGKVYRKGKQYPKTKDNSYLLQEVNGNGIPYFAEVELSTTSPDEDSLEDVGTVGGDGTDPSKDTDNIVEV